MGASSSKVKNTTKPKELNADKLIAQSELIDVFERLDLTRRAPSANGALTLESLKDWEEEASKVRINPRLMNKLLIYQMAILTRIRKSLWLELYSNKHRWQRL